MASAMIRPDVAEFDRTEIPSLKLLRCLPAELHGVIVKLHDALKEMRSCVFRIGQDVMQDAEIALVAGMPSDVLVSTLPAIIRKGMMARDDTGALFSPHFYDKVLRSEERAARKAQAEQDRAQWVVEAQARGGVPTGLTPKQLASILNGRKGGRPRKNGVPVAGQKNMPFYGVVGGTENPNKKPESAQVMENANPTGSLGSLEEEREYTNLTHNISSSSLSREPENPKPGEAEVKRIAQKAREAGGIGSNQRTYSENYVRSWLRDGADEELILRVVASKRGEAEKFVYFDIPVRQAMQEKGSEPAAQPIVPKDDAERRAQEQWKRAQPIWARMMQETRDIGVVERQWPPVAQEYDLPACAPRYDAYVAHFRAQTKGSEAVAA